MRLVRRWVLPLLAAAWLACGSATLLVAQQGNAKTPEPAPSKDYTKSYGLVLLLVGLGVLVVSRPGRRAEQARPGEGD